MAERALRQGRWRCPALPLLLAGQIRELLETLPVLLLLGVLCGLDGALYSIFDTIRHHSFLQYSFRSERARGEAGRLPAQETPPEEHPPLCGHPTPILPILSPPSASQPLPVLPNPGVEYQP